MKKSTKKELAISFLEELSEIKSDRLQSIIREVVGEELAAVMFNYARQIIEANPERVTENASSLLILGYLIRVHEQGQLPSKFPPV
jgi:hypothetical protein